jgi:hypothetical protein
MLIGLAYIALLTSFMTFDRISSQTSIRNEANVILANLNAALKNINQVVPDQNETDVSYMKKITVISKSNSPSLSEKRTELQFNDESLWMDGRKINDANFSVEGSYFSTANGELEVFLSIKKKSGNTKPMYTYTIFDVNPF